MRSTHLNYRPKTVGGYFPSFSAGWTASNEEFFANIVNTKALSFLKFRASWGQNGNIDVLNGYRYSTTINYNGSWYQYGATDGAPTYGSAPSGLANPDLKWETSEQLDLGVEMRFLNDRLSVNFDYYNKKTKDLLVSISPAAEVGIGSTTINGGNVLNSGLEFEATWKDRIVKISPTLYRVTWQPYTMRLPTSILLFLALLVLLVAITLSTQHLRSVNRSGISEVINI